MGLVWTATSDMLRNVTRDGQSSARSCHEACTGRFGTESRKAKLLESPPSWCPPDAKMAQLVRANAQAVSGIDPTPVISLGGTDARLWRYKDLPAIVYGPSPTGMGSTDEPQKRNTALFLPNGATTPRTRGDRDKVAVRAVSCEPVSFPG